MSSENKSIENEPSALVVRQLPLKDTGVAYLWWFFLGVFGAHRIYLGNTVYGIFMAVTGGGLLFLWLLDLFLIPSAVRASNRRITDGEYPSGIGTAIGVVIALVVGFVGWVTVFPVLLTFPLIVLVGFLMLTLVAIPLVGLTVLPVLFALPLIGLAGFLMLLTFPFWQAG